MIESKFIILHYHIFKNAGSTIEYILKNNFKDNHHDIHGSNENSSVTLSEIEKFTHSNPTTISLTSHHLRYPVSDFENYKIIDIVYIRHPIDRLYSMFAYYDKIKWQTAQKLLISDNFPEFLEKILEIQPFNSINSQTNFFSNASDYYFPPNDLDLEKAIRYAKKVRWLGTVDQFDKSIKTAKYFLNPIFKNLNIDYITQNTTTNPSIQLDIELKINTLKSKFGKVIDLAIEYNSLDIKLWEACNQEINRRYSYTTTRNSSL
jgi:hypothetical protein